MLLEKTRLDPVSHSSIMSVESQEIERAQQGDPATLEGLIHRHRFGVYLTALQLVGNREDALDLTQETLLRFLRSIARLDPMRPLRPWLLQIVRNLVRDRARRCAARKTDSLDDLLATGSSEPAGARLDPEESVIRRELQRRVWDAVNALPANYREVVVLRDYRDLSYSEIAGMIGKPIGTVMSRLHMARRLLRETLGDIRPLTQSRSRRSP